ncbi:MAG: agmatinase [Rhizobiaceae bacterium]|nr:agmatinase [Rhizobiaceae bacterium]
MTDTIHGNNSISGRRLNQPISGNEIPRFAGITTMLRLPHVEDPKQLDVGFIGVPLDIGTANKSGTRYGPRQIRAESAMIRACNQATRAAPYESLAVGDLGDVATNPYSLERAVDGIEEHFSRILDADCIPLAMGGDHTLTLPILRAMAKKHGPVAVIHVDAHADSNDHMFHEKLNHGVMFRRAMEERLIDPNFLVQIGLRGTGYTHNDFDWGRSQGFWIVPVERCWHRSLGPLLDEIRMKFDGKPVYVSFDIDSLDPAFAPGTGAIEPGGLTIIQALEIIRGMKGLNIVGCDLVEVLPFCDPSGNTAGIAANLLFEMLCILPGVKYNKSIEPSSCRDGLPTDWI